jgi:pimeloyl-ACP methyl ester carboxylesterase
VKTTPFTLSHASLQQPLRFLLVACALTLWASISLAQETTFDYTPLFEEGACATTLPDDMDATCGTLTVPEDRSNPDSRNVILPVVIVHHPDGNPAPDPVIYLEGGPGGSPLAQFNIVYPLLFENFHLASNRDLIVFDQRGTGFAEPALTCPEVNNAVLESFDYEVDGEILTLEEVGEYQNEALRQCGERLQEEAYLPAYTTRDNAADVRDLAIALGYDEVNLWGISYGSKLALTVMRDAPEIVRASIIDAVLPPEIDFFSVLPGYIDRAYNVLFDRCEADTVCNEAYPNLRDVFYGLVEQFNEEPIILDTLNPSTGLPIEGVVFDGYSLLNYLFTLLYQTDLLPYLPQLIYDLQDGDYRSASLFTQITLQQYDLISIGMNSAFQCQDEAPFVDMEVFEAEIEAYPIIGEFVTVASASGISLDYCSAYALGEVDPAANEAIVSDIPTLVMSGEFDPITPPVNGDIAAENLANSYVYTVTGTGHGASPSDSCPIDISAQFLNNPTQEPDASCLADIDKPQWVTPDTPPPTVTLAETILPNGKTALLPEGWIEVQAGTYVRQSNPLDQTALIALTDTPLGREVFVLTFAAGVGAAPPEVQDIVFEDSGEWYLYTLDFQGYPAYIAALSDDGGLQTLILVANDAEEMPYLYENVLLPAIASYED